MNLYLLVEGEETELQLYPRWLSYFTPQLTRVYDYRSAQSNNYYLFSGGGIPSIYNHTINAIKDINSAGGYDYLIVSLDAEELTAEERASKLTEHLAKNRIQLTGNCELSVVVHKPCIETWFLGNRKVYKRNPQGEKFRAFSQHYNVEKNDPELMTKMPTFSTTAHFHEAYLKEMLREHKIRYRKSRPNVVLEEYYLEELIRRVEDEPHHLKSLKKCFDLLTQIQSKLTTV